MIDREPEKEFLISFSDIRAVFQRSKKKVAAGALFAAFFIVFLLAARPVQFEVKGSFQEKNDGSSSLSGGDFNNSLLSMISGKESSRGLSMMKSRKLLEQVVLEQGLQLSIRSVDEEQGCLRNIQDNFLAEWAWIRQSQKLAFPDRPKLLFAEEVRYSGEEPKELYLIFLKNGEYEISNELGVIVGYGELGRLFTSADYQFLLRSLGDNLEGKRIVLTLSPLFRVATDLSKRFDVKVAKEDKRLLQMSFQFPDRHTAANILNSTMWNYCSFLRHEHDRVAREQVSYLRWREAESSNELKNRLNEFAATLSSDFSGSGFAAEKAIEFLARSQEKLLEKLHAIELEKKRHEKSKETATLFFSLEQGEKSFLEIMHSIWEIERYSDTLELAIRSSPYYEQDTVHQQVEKGLEQLQEVVLQLGEVKEMIAYLKNGVTPPEHLYSHLRAHPLYALGAFYEKLNVETVFLKEQEVPIEQDKMRNYFLSYLQNLHHYLSIYEKKLEEQVGHQQGSSHEFQGISLPTAKELYLGYCIKLNEIESKRAQYDYTIRQMQELPDFEASSLITLLEDEISLKMVGVANALALELRGETALTEKEQQRLRRELAVQMTFLQHHLQQTASLLKLGEELLHRKIFALQKVTFSLIQQELSINRKQFSDAVDLRLTTLDIEQEMFEQKRKELKQELQQLPSKWVAEKLINSQIHLNQKIVEEVARLVETTNISHNLATIQSAPIDQAVPPIHPRPPYLLIFGILSALLAAFGILFFILCRASLKGLPASADNLQMRGAKHLGSLHKAHLEAIRRITAFLHNQPGTEKSVLLLTNHAADYSEELAGHLGRKGLKILLIKLSSQEEVEDQPGLWQFLLGSASMPAIMRKAGYDVIPVGAKEKNLCDLIDSPGFLHLKHELGELYDWIIFQSDCSPLSAEAAVLLQQVTCSVATMQKELLPQLTDLIVISRQGRLAFIDASP